MFNHLFKDQVEPSSAACTTAQDPKRGTSSRSAPASTQQATAHGRPERTEAGRTPSPAGSATAADASSGRRDPKIARILDLSVPVKVILAERDMPVEAVLQFNTGTIIEFDVPFDSPLALEVANRPIGQGVAVKVGENFGLRIKSIDTLRQRIDAMGQAAPL